MKKWTIYFHKNKNRLLERDFGTDEEATAFKNTIREQGWKLLEVKSVHKSKENDA